jgi:hypothetical protein
MRGFVQLSLLAYGLIALAILGTLGTIAYQIRESGKESERAVWVEKAAKQRAIEEQNISDAVKEFEELRAARKIEYRHTTEVVNREVEKLVYRNVCIPDSGLCLANAAILGKSADTCNPDGGVPSTKPAG